MSLGLHMTHELPIVQEIVRQVGDYALKEIESHDDHELDVMDHEDLFLEILSQ
ncbi:hypothetical protein AURDEDRAFT_167760 [Auricularia subglabra TFB-10046 SS5]|nr:hypothetical protein AURDEDRAFT_167760 [Auricularia subglabra TFB-10046 SS5]